MRYAQLNKNDVVNGEGVCVSLFVQGCRRHCEGCFNPETWDFNGGFEANEELDNEIIEAINANGIQRNFSILGGEPLEKENREYLLPLVKKIKTIYPNIKIYLWTSEYLMSLHNKFIKEIDELLEYIDYIIDGPFDIKQKDFTLKLRGSRNQRFWKKDKNGYWIIQYED